MISATRSVTLLQLLALLAYAVAVLGAAIPLPSPLPSSGSDASALSTSNITAPVIEARESELEARSDKSSHKAPYATWYVAGLGACGYRDNGKTGDIIAVSQKIWKKSDCNKKITLTAANGNKVTATMRDRCVGCSSTDLDISEHAMAKLYPKDYKSRGIAKVTWKWN
ncbi:hypothetical protein BKA62DRAFT_708003 [Auriculariales sp. MPI-PUGE-AT-0066]|nr:hypothetical protein BKA62DRAFT_708003 [Auriculariales sp. MPI-PUGE-AT-0066]